MNHIKNIIVPNEINSNIAELVGIIFGDGELSIKSNYSYYIKISLNSEKDKNYALFIKELFFKIFYVEVTQYIYVNKHCICLSIYSKLLVKYLHDVLDIPYSPKMLKSIPDYIIHNDELLKSFLRGLFDTDGCVVIQKQGKYEYPLVKICTMHKLFAENIKSAFHKLGMNAYICVKKDKCGHIGFDVVLRNGEAQKFVMVIGSHNDRNIIKWKQNWDCWDLKS